MEDTLAETLIDRAALIRTDNTNVDHNFTFHYLHSNNSATAAITNADHPQCFNCHITQTPLWRRLDDGTQCCNACGLYYKHYGSHRPIAQEKFIKRIQNKNTDHADQVKKKKRKRGRSGEQCVNCGQTETPLWRKNSDKNTICNACGLYHKMHGHDRPVSLVVKKKLKKLQLDLELDQKTERRRSTSITHPSQSSSSEAVDLGIVSNFTPDLSTLSLPMLDSYDLPALSDDSSSSSEYSHSMADLEALLDLRDVAVWAQDNYYSSAETFRFEDILNSSSCF